METQKTATELVADLDLIQMDSLLELICLRLDDGLSVSRDDLGQLVGSALQAHA